ncbi:MAG: type II toxin-antitoxin system HicA family toxin [Planctomycetota bacterium]|jgi:mRNA interferase HicA
MKKKDLCAKLKEYGWWKAGEGGRYEKWTNGTQVTAVPRHREINEITAKSILKAARENPGQSG